jgi:HK97 family phage major capsid protein
MPDGSFNLDLIALAADLKRAADDVRVAKDDVKKVAETTTTEVKNLGKITDETKGLADQALAKQGELTVRLDQIEQKMARASLGSAEPEQRKSLGEQVVENAEIKALMTSGRGKATVELKAIISALTTDALGSAGDLLVPDRRPGFLPLLQPRLFVRDLLTPGRTDTTAIQWVQETGFTNAAASVSEVTGALKPQSDIKFDIRTTSVTTLAHWVLATRQILSDAPQLQSYIDGRLMYGLKAEEERQLLMGAGTGTDLTGIYTAATTYAAPITITGATRIDQLRLAILQSSLAEIDPTGIVLHPNDWAAIELSKETSGAYLFASPTQGLMGPRLWGLPVVPTKALGVVGRFVVGAFRMGAQIFDRWDATILVSTEDSDNFRKNLVTILAEERLALAIYRPEAFIKGTFV